MIDPMWAAIGVLWLVVILQGLLLLGTLRQLGQLTRRLGGEHPMDKPSTLGVGSILPTAIESPAGAGLWRIFLFVSPTCGVCEQVLDGLHDLITTRSSLVLVPQAGGESARRYLDRYRLGLYPRIDDPTGSVTAEAGVTEVPFAVLVDGSATVRRTAVVNSAYQVELMLEAASSGNRP